jgi:hypothetical protein
MIELHSIPASQAELQDTQLGANSQWVIGATIQRVSRSTACVGRHDEKRPVWTTMNLLTELMCGIA